MKQTIIIIRKKQILMLAALVIIILSCSQSTEPNPSPFKDPREMIWTVDTLSYPGSSQTLMTSIWASSPTEIWICGHNDRSKGNIWKYDGTIWDNIPLFDFITSSPLDIKYVFGSDSNNIYVVGARLSSNPSPPPNFLSASFIVEHNGLDWIEQPIDGNSLLQSVYGNSANNIWVCGHDGLIFHYDGISWIKDTIYAPYTKGSNFQLNSIAVHNEKTYVLGNLFDEINIQDVYYFFEGDIGNWVLLDSMRTSADNSTLKWGVGRLYASPWGKLYSTGWGVFEWDGNEWNKIIPFFGNSNPIRWMDGISEDNMILVGDFGSAYYWDGTDLYPIEGINSYPNGPLYTAVWYNGYETFIVGNLLDSYPQKTIVFHGK